MWRVKQDYAGGAGNPDVPGRPEVVASGLSGPAGLAFSADGTRLLVTQSTGGSVARYVIKDAAPFVRDSTVGLGFEPFDSKPDAPSVAGFNRPFAVAEVAAGRMYVLDSGTGRIREVTPTGIRTVAGFGSIGRTRRGPGLSASDFYMGLIQSVDLDRSGVTAANLGDGTALSRLVCFMDKDTTPGTDAAAVEVRGIDRVARSVNGPAPFQTPATCSVLFENMITRDRDPDPKNAANRTLDVVTGLSINPVTRPATPSFTGDAARQADLLDRWSARTAPVAVSIAGAFSIVHGWDGVFREWSYSTDGFAGQGYRILAGTGPAGTNVNGPGGFVQVEKPRLCKYDLEGNLYFVTASKEGTLLRRILRNEALNEQGLLQTVAGGGKAESPLIGTGRPVLATQVNLGDVVSMDVDTQGQVYLASGSKILRFNRDGSIVTMYASSKARVFKSIAFDEQDQAVYFTAGDEPYIRKVFFPRSS